MKQFKIANNLTGWIVFAIAAITYLLTIEPTASFWDCGEFISTAYRLEVGHPPGAPFFMLMGRFFSLFASDASQVAKMINSLSALASAFTILFLFWSITHLARKIVAKDESKISLSQQIAILGAGAVGALAYTFSDTFWFSAVEGEVYASSSFFTAIVFWAILKWEDTSDKAHADRWLILIAYLMGLSIGVHLLNLLAIPAIVLVYYFKKYPISIKGIILALLSSVAILGLLMYGLIPGVMKVASWIELFFVNSLSLPFNSGLIFYLLLLFSVLIWGIYESYSEKNIIRIKVSFLLSVILLGIPFIFESVFLGILVCLGLIVYIFYTKKEVPLRLVHTILMALFVIVIGYSSYAMIVIRSAANPPMDQNSPDNVFALQSYLNREQYGDRPLLYGQTYNAELKLDVKGEECIPVTKEGATIWAPAEKKNPSEKDRYIATGKKITYVYDDKFNTLFPRMYSSDESHIKAYKEWANVKGRKVIHDRCGQTIVANVPTFGENLFFFFSYQLNYMYWRYFMWNFSGRQNDMQGSGDIDKGNWITGIDFIDALMIGPQKDLPPYLANNKGHNKYYLLPFLLGILGIIFQLYKGKKGVQDFWVTFTLFFMTGIAIVLYLNQTPFQPRERDYAYAGSFYAFSIWIGLGVLAIAQGLEQLLKNKTLSATIATLLCLFVPTLMASENWDDHDRSGRTTARDFGYNYLISCAPNAIIFTNGDNDTFPLWYNQEVEGVRTDVRVCNLSYLQTDWYIDQMRREAYESKPLPISWTRDKYVQGTRDIAYVYDLLPQLEIHAALAFVADDNPQTKDEGNAVIPSTTLLLPVDKTQVLKTKTVDEKDAAQIVDTIPIKLKRRLLKHELMILEMLAQNNWERPMYFAVTVGSDYYIGLGNYFKLEGMAHRIVPIKDSIEEGGINTEVMFDNMINKFRWGGVDNPKVYLDENNLRMCKTFRLMFKTLVEGLIKEGKNEKALQALDYALKVIPGKTVPHDYTSTFFAQSYYTLNQKEKGNALVDEIADNCCKNINWYLSLKNKDMINSIRSDLGYNLAVLENLLQTAHKAGSTEIVDKYGRRYEYYIQKLGYQ